MSYEEVTSLIRKTYSKYAKPISPASVATRINSTKGVAKKALEMLCKDGFCRQTGREQYRVTSSQSSSL